MKKLPALALLGAMSLVLVLPACSSGPKHEAPPAASAPMDSPAPMAAPAPKVDRN